MGLEPTTFCMASRRSSQLSYIRERGQYSRGGRALGRVESLVDELVGELVVLAAYRGVVDAAEPACQAAPLRARARGAPRSSPVLAAHLLDDQLGVGDDLELVDAELDAPSRGRRRARGTRRRCSSRRRSSRRARQAPCRPRPRARSRTRPGRGCRARRRRWRAAPSRLELDEWIELERGLLVRVRLAQRSDDRPARARRAHGLERAPPTRAAPAPRCRSTGSRLRPARNVPVPAVYQEQRS